MNILLAFFKIQDYGGIINYAETLAKGFKEIGHSISSVMLTNSGVNGVPSCKDRSLDDGWEYGEGLDLWLHPKNGFEGMYKYNYAKTSDWSGFDIEKYDVVIYIVPVPSHSKPNIGNYHWMGLFSDISVNKQIVTIHDSNLRKLYPYIYEIHQYLDYMVCVHESSWNSSEVIPCKRAFILNPHNVPNDIDVPFIKDRNKGIVSMQIFKYWKRVDKFVRLIQHLDLDTESILAGTGIEYHYMTSINKCKPAYINPDGTRIWDEAIDNGLDYMGVVDSIQRTKLFKDNKILVDFSYSKLLVEFGPVSNRTIVEAMAQGCVPALVSETMAKSGYFVPNENYLPIPFNESAERQAALIEEWLDDDVLLQRIQNNNFELARKYEKSHIADSFIRLVNDDYDYTLGVEDNTIAEKSKQKIKQFTEL